ncbi:MAG TPA: AAA family ATPase [Caproicibacter sp.]|nr:AAA family ATPase [Caproicibacter sp.]
MKKLILVNGTMGVGKSTVCRELLKILTPGVYLDGDWCWNMNPFVVSEENKAMVEGNITYLLKSYLRNSGYEYVVFCWVMHQEEIFEQILSPLRECEFELHKFSLVCTEKALRKRIMADVETGARTADVLERSIPRLALYRNMDTMKIDVSEISARQAAEKIAGIIRNSGGIE